jgi:hypothetical protein
MRRVTYFVLFAGVSAIAGCASQQQQLAAKQPAAIETALQRGRFDLNCPAATATVLSQDFIQPAMQGPWVSGLERVEYTIGVEGCNQRTTYIVICQTETATCFAANPEMRGRFQGP